MLHPTIFEFWYFDPGGNIGCTCILFDSPRNPKKISAKSSPWSHRTEKIPLTNFKFRELYSLQIYSLVILRLHSKTKYWPLTFKIISWYVIIYSRYNRNIEMTSYCHVLNLYRVLVNFMMDFVDLMFGNTSGVSIIKIVEYQCFLATMADMKWFSFELQVTPLMFYKFLSNWR